MGTTTYPHGKAEDSRDVGGGSLPSAYIRVVPKNEGPLFEMLQQFLSAAADHTAVVPLDRRKVAQEGVDSWLEHAAAAEYLGVGRSTARNSLPRYGRNARARSCLDCSRSGGQGSGLRSSTCVRSSSGPISLASPRTPCDVIAPISNN